MGGWVEKGGAYSDHFDLGQKGYAGRHAPFITGKPRLRNVPKLWGIGRYSNQVACEVSMIQYLAYGSFASPAVFLSVPAKFSASYHLYLTVSSISGFDIVMILATGGLIVVV